MHIEMESGVLYLNGKRFCLYDDKDGVKAGDYSIIPVVRGGKTYPYIVGCDTIFHGEEGRNAGVIVAEFIVDGVPIGSRAKIAHLVKHVVHEIEQGGKIELEVS